MTGTRGIKRPSSELDDLPQQEGTKRKKVEDTFSSSEACETMFTSENDTFSISKTCGTMFNSKRNEPAQDMTELFSLARRLYSLKNGLELQRDVLLPLLLEDLELFKDSPDINYLIATYQKSLKELEQYQKKLLLPQTECEEKHVGSKLTNRETMISKLALIKEILQEQIVIIDKFKNIDFKKIKNIEEIKKQLEELTKLSQEAFMVIPELKYFKIFEKWYLGAEMRLYPLERKNDQSQETMRPVGEPHPDQFIVTASFFMKFYNLQEALILQQLPYSFLVSILNKLYLFKQAPDKYRNQYLEAVNKFDRFQKKCLLTHLQYDEKSLAGIHDGEGAIAKVGLIKKMVGQQQACIEKLKDTSSVEKIELHLKELEKLLKEGVLLVEPKANVPTRMTL